MRKGYLQVLIFDLMQLIDQGKHAGISIEDVHNRIHAHDILKWLRGKYPDNLRFSKDEEQDSEIHEALDRIVNAYGGEERKRWGIENSGICILINWCIELFDEADSKPSKDQSSGKLDAAATETEEARRRREMLESDDPGIWTPLN